jgi:hypothetical protein
MANANAIKFGKVLLLLGDGATSEVFEAPCAIENLSMNININSNTVSIPDCSDVDLAAWLATDIVSKQMTLQGSGTLDTGAMQTWKNWWFDGGPTGEDERNVRWYRDLTSGNGGGYFQAPAVMTAYAETGQRGQRWQNSFTIALNGKPTWSPIA